MRLLRSGLMIAMLAGPAFLAASGPANAICFKRCTGILASGVCSGHESVCGEIDESVAHKMKPLRVGMRCSSKGMLCDWGTCKPVCGTVPKKK